MKILYLLLALVSLGASAADTTIAGLPAAAALGGTEPLPVVQAGDTVRTTPAAVSTYVKAGLTKSDVALGNVDNTSNATERAATATLTNKTISGASNTLTNLPAGGSTTQVQLNAAGLFAGDADLTYNTTTNVLSLGSLAVPGMIVAPNGSASAGAGLNIRGGDGVGTNKAGGVVDIRGGAATGSGLAGYVRLGSTANGLLEVGNLFDMSYTASVVGGDLAVIFQNNSNNSNSTTTQYIQNDASDGFFLGVQSSTATTNGFVTNVATPTSLILSFVRPLALGAGSLAGLTVNSAGAVTYLGAPISGGTKFTATGCSLSTTVGGRVAGTFASGTTGACTVVITLPSAPTGWSCAASDRTTPANLIAQSASSTTSCTITGTTISGDVIGFQAMGY